MSGPWKGRPRGLPLILGLSVLLLMLQIPVSAESGKAKSRALFLETGLFLGSESDIPIYTGSFWRIYTEGGVDFNSGRRGRWGAGLAFEPARDDYRLALAARWSRRLDPSWSLQFGAGPLFSSKSEEAALFGTGWQARFGLRHRRHFSLNLLYHELPYYGMEVGPPGGGQGDPFSGTMRSVYGGILLDDAEGAWLGAGFFGALALIMAYVLMNGV